MKVHEYQSKITHRIQIQAEISTTIDSLEKPYISE